MKGFYSALLLALGAVSHVCAARNIGSVEDLVNFSKGLDQGSWQDEDLNITADLDLSTFGRTEPIGTANQVAWKGNFYGNNHVIRNFVMKHSSFHGESSLFYRVEGSTIQQIIFDVTCEVSGAQASMFAYQSVDSQFTDVRNRGKVSGTNAGGIVTEAENTNFTRCANEGEVKAVNLAGGLASSMKIPSDNSIFAPEKYVRIKECANSGAITISDGRDAGGIFGQVDAGKHRFIISDCNNSGTVRVRFSGVSEPNIGGLVGTLSFAKGGVQSCNNSGHILAEISANAGGIVGKITYTSEEAYMDYCFNFGDVEGTTRGNSGYTQHQLGGIVGSLNVGGSEKAHMRQCFNYGSVTSNAMGGSIVSGIVGYANDMSRMNIQDSFNMGDIKSNWYSYGIVNGGTLKNVGNRGSVSGYVATGICRESSDSVNVVNSGPVSGELTFPLWMKSNSYNQSDQVFHATSNCEYDDIDVFKKDGQYVTCSAEQDVVTMLNLKAAELDFAERWTKDLLFNSTLSGASHACCAAALLLVSALLHLFW